MGDRVLGGESGEELAARPAANPPGVGVRAGLPRHRRRGVLEPASRDWPRWNPRRHGQPLDGRGAGASAQVGPDFGRNSEEAGHLRNRLPDDQYHFPSIQGYLDVRSLHHHAFRTTTYDLVQVLNIRRLNRGFHVARLFFSLTEQCRSIMQLISLSLTLEDLDIVINSRQDQRRHLPQPFCKYH